MPSPENRSQNQFKQDASEEEQQPTRELTQTDLLNKQLLKSFLAHMNSGQMENVQKNEAELEEDDRLAEFEE